MIYSITCFVLRLLCRILFRCKSYGMGNVPKKGPCIIASNHVSHLDPIVIGAFMARKLNYIAKRELYKNRYFGWYMRKLRTIPMDRNNVAYSSLKEVIQRIKEGMPIVMFPEGTRGDGKTFLEPEAGVGYFALKYNLSVVPVYVKGTDKALPRETHFIRLKPISVYYGKAARYEMPSGIEKSEAYMGVSRKVMEEIKKLKARYGSQN